MGRALRAACLRDVCVRGGGLCGSGVVMGCLVVAARRGISAGGCSRCCGAGRGGCCAAGDGRGAVAWGYVMVILGGCWGYAALVLRLRLVWWVSRLHLVFVGGLGVARLAAVLELAGEEPGPAQEPGSQLASFPAPGLRALDTRRAAPVSTGRMKSPTWGFLPNLRTQAQNRGKYAGVWVQIPPARSENAGKAQEGIYEARLALVTMAPKTPVPDLYLPLPTARLSTHAGAPRY